MKPNVGTSTITIAASIETVWTVLADEFVDIAAWSPGVVSSGPNPATPEGLNGSRYGGRVADIEGLGHTDVRLTDYDADARTLSYTVDAENIPPFIERLSNTWTVVADGADRCTVKTEVTIAIAESMAGNEQVNKAVGAMLAAGTGASADLKTFIESRNS